jgi:hypothetical protein
VAAGLPQRKTLQLKIARILIAKPATTFAEYALKPIFSVLNFRRPPLTLVNHIETIP